LILMLSDYELAIHTPIVWVGPKNNKIIYLSICCVYYVLTVVFGKKCVRKALPRLVVREGPRMKDLLKEVRVVVIGAGVAGLTAAQRLLQAGITDLVLLEAANRFANLKTIEFPIGTLLGFGSSGLVLLRDLDEIRGLECRVFNGRLISQARGSAQVRVHQGQPGGDGHGGSKGR
jgi:hypothetical protein